MTTPLQSRSASRRLWLPATVAFAALTAALAACTGPEPTPYPAQPDFARVVAPAQFVATATSTPVSFSADYADSGPAYDPDKIMNASQGGYAPMTNPRWFIDRLPQLSEMGITEVRIDHVLDDTFYHVVSAASDGTISYDFSRLDPVIQAITDQGMQPLLALSYTPSLFGKTYDVPPAKEWAAAASAVVSHYVSLGHTGWDWEIWNEPDHDRWTAKQYNALYAATAPAVKAADPTARVGGATASYFTSEGDISGQFIRYAGDHPEIPVDFFSVHSYSSDNWDVVDAAEADLALAGLDIPVLITEWALNPTMNLGPGLGSDTNSSPTGAAYVARRLALAAESSAERMFYFSPVEGLTYALPYNGDLGLLTVDGHRKAIGNIFEMYAQLGDTTLPIAASGNGTETRAIGGFATKDTTTSNTTVLLWNATDSDASATLTLRDLPYTDHNVRITQHIVSGTQGNGFSDASTTVAAAYPSPNENAPVTSDEVVEPLNEYSTDVTIPAAGVVAVRLASTDLDTGMQQASVEPAAVNVAAGASGAVVTGSSSVEDPSNGWSAAAANDGRRYSVDVDKSVVRGWSSDTHPEAQSPESLTVDLGAVTPIDSVSLWPYTTRSQASSGYPLAAEITGSVDGTEWKRLATLSGDPDDPQVSGEQPFSFDATEVRYVRVEATTLGAVTRRQGTYAFQLAEIEVYRTGVPNGGFEAGDLTGWEASGTVEVEHTVHRRGARAAQVAGKSSISSEIRGLRPNTTYTVGAYVKASSAGQPVTLTASLPASGTFDAATATFNWEHRWVTFTTGGDETSVTIKIANGTGAGVAFVDDVSLSQVPMD